MGKRTRAYKYFLTKQVGKKKRVDNSSMENMHKDWSDKKNEVKRKFVQTTPTSTLQKNCHRHAKEIKLS